MSNQKISTKKLKAIVFTDIVDFTKISTQDEQKALDLIQKQNEIIKDLKITFVKDVEEALKLLLGISFKK